MSQTQTRAPRGNRRGGKGERTEIPPSEQQQARMLDNPENREAIHKDFESIRVKKADRAALNADILALRKNLQARGLTPQAINRVLQDLEMDDSRREATQIGYLLGCASMGIPVQGELSFPPADGTTH